MKGDTSFLDNLLLGGGGKSFPYFDQKDNPLFDDFETDFFDKKDAINIDLHSEKIPVKVDDPVLPPAPFHQTKSKHEYKSMRPPVREIIPNTEDFEFFAYETEYRVTQHRGVEIYIYGDTADGNSVVVRTSGFDPYFVIKRPSKELWNPGHHFDFIDALDRAVREHVGTKGDAAHFTRLVKGCSFFSGNDLCGYHGEKPEDFMKITVAYPSLVRICRLMLEYPKGKKKTPHLPEIKDWWPQDLPIPVKDPFFQVEKHNGYPRYFFIYEANTEFTLRFQVDHKIRATGWVKLQKAKYQIIPIMSRDSFCQIEIKCDHNGVGPSTKTSKEVPPISLYSYDSECQTGPEGEFCQAIKYEKNSKGEDLRDWKGKRMPIPGSGEKMLQMGFSKIQGDEISQGVHMIGSSGPVQDSSEMYCYENEFNFLRGFKTDIEICDPTFVVDYNGSNFDKPYLIDRMKQTGVWEHFGDLGRLKKVKSDYKNSTFNSSAHKTEKFSTNINGRVQIDVMQCLKRDFKLRSYGLNAVSNEYLGRSKVEMDYKMINTLQEGSPEDRAQLAYYCMIDALLPWQLIVQLKLIIGYVQMAHVAGVTIQQLLDRGQQLRMLAQVYHYSKDTRDNPYLGGLEEKLSYPFVIPVHPTFLSFPNDKFEGAVVIKAETGYHERPVTTLDFNSLYPSTMIAHNLCYTTYVTKEQIKTHHLIEGVHYKRVPDWELQKDGSVIQVENLKNPCFLLTPEKSIASVINRFSLQENKHYKNHEKRQILLANQETRDLLSDGQVQEGVHYEIVEDAITKESVIKFFACKTGALPTILRNLLNRRGQVKKQMNDEKDPKAKARLNALQNSLKLLANSIYGGTGTGEKGYLPLREIAETVTRYGRGYILFTKWKVESKFNRKNGYPFDAKAIYGDTDSDFIRHDNIEAPLLRPEGDPWKYDLVNPTDPKKNMTITSKYDFDLVRDYGIEMAKYITDEIGIDPMCLAYEKSFNGILLVSKKRYAGFKLVWDKGILTGDTKFSATGLECVRRDSCPLVGEMVSTVLKKIIVDKDVPAAVSYVKGQISILLQGKMRYSKLIITKALSRRPAEYKVKSAHAILAQRIDKRDPGKAYKLGDRVKYVVVPGTKNQKTFELGEDPLFAFDNGITPNYKWYLENQLQKPLQRIFFFVMKNKDIMKQMMEIDKDESWVKIHKGDADLLDLDALQNMTDDDFKDMDDEEDREDEAMEEEELQRDGDDIWEMQSSHVTPSSCHDPKPNGNNNNNDGNDDMDQSQDTPRILSLNPNFSPFLKNAEQKPTEKRKASCMSDFFKVKTAAPIVKKKTKFTKEELKKKEVKEGKEQQKQMKNSAASKMLFSGSHMMTISKGSAIVSQVEEKMEYKKPKGTTGIGAFATLIPQCQICGASTKNPRAAICKGCSTTNCHICNDPNGKLEDEPCKICVPKQAKILKAKQAAIERTQKLEEETFRCWDKCRDCVKGNPSIDFRQCPNVDCENLWDRKIAHRDLAKERNLKLLDW